MDSTQSAAVGDMFGALEEIVRLTHNEKGSLSRLVNKVALGALIRVWVATGLVPFATKDAQP